MVVRTVKGQGGEYVPSNPPQDGDARALRDWMSKELQSVATAISEGRCMWLRLDVLATAPDRPVRGMVCYFDTGAVSVGSARGVWSYDGTSWIAA